MKKILIIVFFLLMMNTSVYCESYNLNINLKKGNVVTILLADIQKIEFGAIGVDDPESPQQIVSSLKLLQNFPNPFIPSTTIKYQIPNVAQVKVRIYDINGQFVKELVNETQTEGLHQLTWDGTDQDNKSVASGVYLYAIESDNVILSKKMILMK